MEESDLTLRLSTAFCFTTGVDKFGELENAAHFKKTVCTSCHFLGHITPVAGCGRPVVALSVCLRVCLSVGHDHQSFKNS